MVKHQLVVNERRQMLSGCDTTENAQVLLVTGGWDGSTEAALSITEVRLSIGKRLRFDEIDKQNYFP